MLIRHLGKSDAAWDELYNIGGINVIPNTEAEKLAEPTVAVLDEPGYSFVGLNVFHQLHCLNWVRKALRPERYAAMNMEMLGEAQKLERFVHIGESNRPAAWVLGSWRLMTDVGGADHCIESLRQSLMCSADVSPVIWHWKKEGGLVLDMNNTHVCRDFDMIKDWAQEHMMTREINSRLPEDSVWDIIPEATN